MFNYLQQLQITIATKTKRNAQGHTYRHPPPAAHALLARGRRAAAVARLSLAAIGV